MNPWLKHFTAPPDGNLSWWFARLANLLLNESQWLIADQSHRLLDIEFYYKSAVHSDPFAHANPIQAEVGRWYFHKTGDTYRSGSFKGLDITFGDGSARAGILIRAIRTPHGEIVDGPSLVVDYVLSRTGFAKIADLDSGIGERRIWDTQSPISIIPSPDLDLPILACARVGLSLRRAQLPGLWCDYLLKPYRFLSEPAGIRKGKAQMVLALYRLKRRDEEISGSVGCLPRVVRHYIAQYELGLATGRFDDYLGRVLTAKDICRLHGITDRAI